MKHEVKCLVVEDSATQRASLEALLRRNGYEVLTAENGAAALAMLDAFDPAIVISDVVMPGMTGFEFCQRIKSDPKFQHVAVMMLTSLSDPEDIFQALECGADSFITKPAEEAQLLDRLEYLVANRRVEEEESLRAGIEVNFAGKRQFITSGRLQILNLLLSSYDLAVKKNGELEKATRALRNANEKLEARVEERTRELRESEERFRQLAEQSADGFWFVALNPERVVYVSPATESIWGLPAKVFYGEAQSWLSAIHPDDRGIVRTAWNDLIEGRARFFRAEYRVVRPDETVRWVLDTGTPIRDEAGKTVRIGGIARDITEQKRLEEQFILAQKMESVGRLAGGVAHDFNNLLSVINGYSDLALRDLSDGDPIREDLVEIRKAGDRAAALTRQLLAFSRKQVLQPVVIDVEFQIQESGKMLQRLIGEDVELRILSQADTGRIKIDPGMFEQVIVNLAVNARDAMISGGKLTIEMRNAELDEVRGAERSPTGPRQYVMIAVSDTGSGMDKATLERAFDPFFTTKDVGKGTGLGLATVHGIVKQSGGHIYAYSELGIGTSFKIFFPRVDEEARPVGRRHSEGIQQGTETILVLEDESSLRALVERILRGAGYDILAPRTSEEALEILRAEPAKVHLLLTDVILPRINGPEVARRMLQIQPKLEVIYMSGYTDDAIFHHGVLQDPAHFIAKPFTAADLTQKVREVLDNRENATGPSSEPGPGLSND